MKALLLVLATFLSVSFVSEANAVVCAKGVYRAGCAGPRGAAVATGLTPAASTADTRDIPRAAHVTRGPSLIHPPTSKPRPTPLHSRPRQPTQIQPSFLTPHRRVHCAGTAIHDALHNEEA
jgi:hypothetical protein